MQKSKAVSKICFNQDVHGQVAKKPTTLLVLRLGNLRKYIYKKQGLYSVSRQVGKLGGWDESGGFRTARAKEYPPSMCLAIARAIVENLSNTEGREHCQIDDDERKFIDFCTSSFQVPCDPYLEINAMRADYMVHGQFGAKWYWLAGLVSG